MKLGSKSTEYARTQGLAFVRFVIFAVFVLIKGLSHPVGGVLEHKDHEEKEGREEMKYSSQLFPSAVISGWSVKNR